MKQQNSLFEAERQDMEDSLATSLASLREYGQRYRHWCVAYSGGKDSTATVTFVAWAIQSGQVAPPESLTVLYADTRMELPPLQQSAMCLLHRLSADGYNARVVLPEMGSRFYVYMLGYGVPPSSNRFRWCTPKLKVEPMHNALTGLRQNAGEKLLMLTGVRIGESAARDARIALSCSKDSGECGQGWFQVATDASVADTLAPLLHWRLCHVYDWLYFEQDRHGYDTSGVATVYGDDDVRTGCVGCPLTSRDTSIERIIRNPDWEHLTPLLELKPLYRELKKPTWRKRKLQPEERQDGQWSTNVQRMGPLTMEGREMGLDTVLDIQRRARVDLINAEEEARIREMWALDMWPRKWSADDADATEPHDAISLSADGKIVRQTLML